jgi:glucose-1-phosphate thymidylyltransferase
VKALVLVGGARHLVPVANRPILFHALDAIAEAGIDEVGIVVCDARAEIEAALGDGSTFGLRLTYMEPGAARGLAHCVQLARRFLGDDEFLVYQGDNLFEDGVAAAVTEFRHAQHDGAGAPAAMVLVKKVEDAQRYGVAVLDPDGKVDYVVDAPRIPTSNLAMVGAYVFDRRIHDAIESITPAERCNPGMTDAIQHLVEHDHRVLAHVVDGWWLGTGTKESFLEANRLLLEQVERSIGGFVDGDSRVEGRVVLEPGAQVIGSTVRGPAIIGAGTRLEHAFVGPCTAIGARCTVVDTEIDHSVLLAGAVMLIVKRGNPVATIVGMVGAVAGGAYAPVDTFPRWLARVADVNPVTYALDAWRGALLDGRSPADLAHPLVVLVAVTAVIGPVAWWSLGRALDVARADGTLGSY